MSDPLAASLAPDDPRLTLIHANFRALSDELTARGISAVDGVLYGGTVKSEVFALDAATGRQLWRFAAINLKMIGIIRRSHRSRTPH